MVAGLAMLAGSIGLAMGPVALAAAFAALAGFSLAWLLTLALALPPLLAKAKDVPTISAAVFHSELCHCGAYRALDRGPGDWRSKWIHWDPADCRGCVGGRRRRSNCPASGGSAWPQIIAVQIEEESGGMLTEQMTQLISTYTIGCIATVRPDGAPAVSPKGTFLVIDDRTIAFGNIRSQATVENVCRNPQVEVNFIDVFARKGCRVRGRGRYASLDGASRTIERGSRRNGQTCTT